jgi:hypothetical protein
MDAFRPRPAPVRRRAQTYADPAQQTATLSCLKRDGGGASLLSTAKRLIELQQHLAAALPGQLGEACRVLRIEDGKLTLGVPTAAHSAKLRQLAPRLADALAKHGWQVNGIAVRVQATLNRLPDAPAPAREPRLLGAQGLQAFSELHDKLERGPLADAVARLLERRRNEG